MENMKNILITGAGSYIGEHVSAWLEKWPDRYRVTTIDMLNDSWKNVPFQSYNVVYHVAGIAHRSDVTDELYERVNHLLAVEVAEKAQNEGVDQFIFMSSGAVYTQSDREHGNLIVNAKSGYAPQTEYGKSKLRADEDIRRLANASGTMKAAILRPPTVYGPNAKGNYGRLSAIAQKAILFPLIENTRSMIYIDNLCEFIRLLIDRGDGGIFLPQNREYINTTRMSVEIARVHGRKLHCTRLMNVPIGIAARFFNVVNKVFGTFYYEKEPYFSDQYQIVDFASSIRMCEAVTSEDEQ